MYFPYDLILRNVLGIIGRLVPKIATKGGPKRKNNILSEYTRGTNVLVRFIGYKSYSDARDSLNITGGNQSETLRTVIQIKSY